MNPGTPLIKEKPKYWQPFLIALVMAVVVFAPFVIMDNGYFLFYGDFNVQQIPFYQMCHDAVREGNIFWNWTTDLGVNFIGSYSFYLLGSPFFWLTIPFPSHVVPYLMAPLFCLKFACAATTSYAFIRRFTRTNIPAVIGGLLYAFSGFSIINIFFNHFHEPLIFFPLLLISVEELMHNRRIGFFALMVALNCIVNYFFFASMVTFTVLYFVIKSLSGGWKFKISKFVQMAIEAVLGVALAMFILMPSLMSVLQNPRVDNMYYGYSALFYGYEQRYGQIIYSLFFPPDLPAVNNFFVGSETKWSSVSAWLPLFGATGVIAFMRGNRGHWAKRIFIATAVMSLVPLLNSAFFMFNSAYYARWFFMTVLIMCMMTACSLDDDSSNWNSGFIWSFAMVAAIGLFIGLYPQKTNDDNYPSGIRYGMYDEFWNYIAWVAIALLLLIISFVLIKLIRKRGRESFLKISLICTCFVCVIWSIIYLGFGKFTFPRDHETFTIPYCLNQGVDINLPGQAAENYRIDVLDGQDAGYDNQSMFWQMRCIQSFHSIIPGSTMEFYPSVGVQRDVGTRPEADQYELRSLLSVRWLFNYQNDEMDPAMPGYTYFGWQNGYYVSSNDNFIPMGFTYDNYITEEDYYSVNENNRAALLLKAVLLKEEDIPKYEDILRHLDMDTVSYDYDSFADDCRQRNKHTADYIKTDNNGFESKITLDHDDLVFFSVPYEKGRLYEIKSLRDLGISNLDGWTCTVDGVKTEIDEVNVAFLGIRLGAGEHTIRFNYRTPGLYLGIIISVAALALFAAYVIIMLIIKSVVRRRKNKAGYDEEYRQPEYYPEEAENDLESEDETVGQYGLEGIEDEESGLTAPRGAVTGALTGVQLISTRVMKGASERSGGIADEEPGQVQEQSPDEISVVFGNDEEDESGFEEDFLATELSEDATEEYFDEIPENGDETAPESNEEELQTPENETGEAAEADAEPTGLNEDIGSDAARPMQDGEIIPEKDNTGERAAQTLRNLEKRSEDAFDLLNASIEDLMRRINASSDDEQTK